MTKKREARVAGLLYLLMAVSGGFGIMYFSQNILAADDATLTAANIRSAGSMYDFAILCILICQVSFIFLVLSLDKLFRDVQSGWSRLMVVLVTAGVPIAMLNTLNLFAAREVAFAPDYLDGFSESQLDALAASFIRFHEFGILIVEVFWGLWLIPLGLLTIKAGFIPKAIGWFLLAGGLAYLLEVTIGIFDLQLKESLQPLLMIPLMLGELSMIFWLLIKGVKE